MNVEKLSPSTKKKETYQLLINAHGELSSPINYIKNKKESAKKNNFNRNLKVQNSDLSPIDFSKTLNPKTAVSQLTIY